MTWVKVISGFDAEDETINFGTRNFAENNGSIYETWTLATIQSDSEVLQNPHVQATLWHGKLCVAVDTCMTVFENQSCQNILGTWNFPMAITSYCLSVDGSFLYVSIEPALLYCYRLVGGERPVFQINFTKKYQSNRIIKTIFQQSDKGNDIIIITSEGNMYRVEQLLDNCENTQVVPNIELVSSRQSAVHYADQVQILEESSDQFVVISNDEFCIWPENVSCAIDSLQFGYKKVQFLPNYSAMLCLRTDGGLSLVCPQTLIGKKLWKGPVTDFITLHEESQDFHHIVVLMAPKDNESSWVLNLMSFPNFEVVFTMPAASTTYLVDIVGSTNEDLVFLEGMQGPTGIVNTIRIKSIGESMPEYRFQRLLRQRRFPEALTFAKNFKLDVECVYRAEASLLIHRLRPGPNNPENTNLSTLLDLLDKITDIKFVYDCCNNALTCDYNDHRRLFVYAQGRISQHMDELKENEPLGNDIQNLVHAVSNTLRKIDTFRIIQELTANDNIEPGSSVNDEWIKFLRANLLDESLKYIARGELNAAALIWTRHTPTIALHMTKDLVIKILVGLPGNLGPSELFPWLRLIIPTITSFLPSALEDILEWAYKKTKNLEKLHHNSWPEIGLKFARGLVDFLHFKEYNVCFQFHQQYTNKNSHLHKLTKLMRDMTDLQELKTRYKVVVPLNTYLGSPTDVVMFLLNKVHVDDIPALLQNFLLPYMLNNSLQNDIVLSMFIQNTLRNTKDWWLWEKAPWDKRLTTIINNLHNVQNRLLQTLEVLKKAPVPWSESLIALAEQSYTYNHPLVSKIRFESNSVPIKLILKKYGFAQVGVCSKLMFNVIKKDRPSVVHDLLELTKSNHNLRLEIFYYCMNYHLSRGNVDRILAIIQDLSDDLVFNCAELIINVTKTKINDYRYQDESLEYYFEVLGPMETRLRRIMTKTSSRAKFNDILTTIPTLRALYRLRVEFNITINQQDYYMHKRRVLLDYIMKNMENHNEESGNWKNLCRKVDKVNDILQLPKFYGLYQLLLLKKNCSDLENCIIDQINKNSTVFQEEKTYMDEICSLLLSEPKNNPNMVEYLKNICTISLLNSKITDLPKLMTIMCRIDAYDQALGTYRDKMIPPTDLQIFFIYTDASMSSSSLLLPLLQDLLKICFFYHKVHENVSMFAEELLEIDVIRASLLDRTRALQNEYNDFSLLKIISTIHAELGALLPESEEILTDVKVLLSHCLTMMLKKVISVKKLDLHLGLTCLFMLPTTEALSTILTAASRFAIDDCRNRTTIDLGYEFCRLTKNSVLDKFHKQKMLHCWAQRLVKYDIPYKDTMLGNIETNRSIMRRLMTSKKPEIVELLCDFCKNFGFEFDNCLFSYLETILCSWEPKYDVYSGVENQRDLNVDDDDVKALSSLCKRIAAQVSDRVALARHLEQLKSLINFYHYEIFEILLELINERTIENMSYLCFLKNYTRVSAPTEIERKEWANISQGPLPTISKWRLPYLPKVDHKLIYKPELNLQTYESWLRIAPILKIPICEVCMLTVTNAVADAVAKTWPQYTRKRSNEWSVNVRCSALLKDIKKCIDHIPGSGGLYYATAALYHVINNIPPGADQVAAAKECFVYSQRWKNSQELSKPSNSDDVERISKIKQKYLRYTSMHILYTHDLGQEKYLKLVEDPEKLVLELYQDETIPQRYRGAVGRRPDINSAVNALGTLFGLSLTQIRLELLYEWLKPESCGNKADDSMTMNIYSNMSSVALSNDTFTVDDNLLKACYIANLDDTESYIKFLISMSFSEDPNDCHSPGERFRALQVLHSITDADSLQNYVKRDIQTINQYMKSLQYVTELERLGLGYSVKSFENYSKHKLVEILVNHPYCTSRTLELIPQIYIDFDIDDYAVLNTALERMVKFGLIGELKKTLVMFGSSDHVVSCSGYIAAWQLVVTDSFDKLDVHSSSDCLENCVETLRLLDKCPVIDKLKFSEIMGSCFRAQQLQFAAALLPFLSPEITVTESQKIIQSGKYNEIRTQLENLAEKGVLMVRQALIILAQNEKVNRF